MGYTISTHNGYYFSRDHNIRNKNITSKEKHIDPNGHYEVWKDERIQDAYGRIFKDAVEIYNSAQTRSDRVINNYYQKVKDSATIHPAYEMIIAIGNADEKVDDQIGREIMKEYVDSWQERNPNMELIGAYYHADESANSDKKGVPHVHIDYIPVGNSYEKGLSKRTSLRKALSEMGFESSGKDLGLIRWQKRENAYLTALCEQKGLTIEKGLSKRDHLSKELYIQTRQLAEIESKKGLLLGVDDIEDIEVDRESDERGRYTGKVLLDEGKYKDLVNTATASKNLAYEKEKLIKKEEALDKRIEKGLRSVEKSFRRVPSPVREGRDLFDDLLVMGIDLTEPESKDEEKLNARDELRKAYRREFPIPSDSSRPVKRKKKKEERKAKPVNI